MPEGHTLHRLARLHTTRYAGHPVTLSSPQGRFDASPLVGAVFVGAEAYGKHLFHDYGAAGSAHGSGLRAALTVHVHLGLYGAFTEFPVPPPVPVGQVRMRIVGPTHGTDLRGPTACELLTEPEVDAIKARLGPDPLRADADPDVVWQRISRSRAPVAVLLMDQTVIAGVGNVYRAELLFRHRIPPKTPGHAVGRAQWDAMWKDLVDLMGHGVDTGSIDTVRPEHMPDAMGRAARDDRHGGEVYVYRRAGQPCHVCGTEVAGATLAARNLYWCPTCQG